MSAAVHDDKIVIAINEMAAMSKIAFFFILLFAKLYPIRRIGFRVSLSRGKNREKHCITLIFSVNQIER